MILCYTVSPVGEENYMIVKHFGGFPGCASGSVIKNRPAMLEAWVLSLGQEDPLEEGIAIDSSILAWRIPWTEEPGRLEPIGWQRAGHD